MNTLSKILEYLDTHGPSTVDQISCDLGLTKADIRHHLHALIRDEKIERSAGRFQNGPGRPAAMFRLKVGTNVPLMRNMLTSLAAGLTQMRLTSREKNLLARKIAASLVAQVEVAGPPSVRISAMIQHLEQLGFDIHWEASSTGPLIVIKKEPISELLSDAALKDLVLECLVDLINPKSPG